jgi:hypothetical protein
MVIFTYNLKAMENQTVYLVMHQTPDYVGVSVFRTNESALARLEEIVEENSLEFDGIVGYSDDGDFVEIKEETLLD